MIAQPRVAVWLGLVSYGIYLWHRRLVAEAARLGGVGEVGGVVMFAVACITATVLIAAASWYILKRRMLTVGQEPLIASLRRAPA
jgi:peptidoglycan/LPS O-acetylase OafA/YrhL